MSFEGDVDFVMQIFAVGAVIFSIFIILIYYFTMYKKKDSFNSIKGVSIEILENDEKIFWQFFKSLKSQKNLFLFSLSVTLFIFTFIGLLDLQYSFLPDIFFRNLNPIILLLIFLLILGISVFVFSYTYLKILRSINIRTSYYATNKRLIKKIDREEYNEYFIWNYTKIKYIDIHHVFLSFKKKVNIRIFPDYEHAGRLDWRVQYFKDSDIKVPRRLDPKPKWFTLYHISDYKELFRVLKQHHILKKK